MTPIASAYEHLLTTRYGESARIPDFLLGVALATPIALPGGVPSLSMLALGIAIFLASLRSPDPGAKLPWWAPVLVTLMIGWMSYSTYYNQVTNYVQLGFFATWALSILAFASGRLDRLSLCRGIGAGLTIGAFAGLLGSFTGIGATSYEGRLTGAVWGDPNQAGYYLTVFTAVALVGLRPGWRRWLPLALFTGTILLTLSRTSIVAMIVAGLWFLVRRRTSPLIGALLVGGLGYSLLDLSERLKNWGPFAQRSGSDALRNRIDNVAAQMVELNPYIGRGPGTAQVEVQGQTFFFHNAYLAVRNNGGWVLLGLFLTLILLVTIALLRRPPAEHHPWHEASLIALLIVGVSVGEAFLRAPAAVAIGLALRHALSPHELRASDDGGSPDRVL